MVHWVCADLLNVWHISLCSKKKYIFLFFLSILFVNHLTIWKLSSTQNLIKTLQNSSFLSKAQKLSLEEKHCQLLSVKLQSSFIVKKTYVKHSSLVKHRLSVFFFQVKSSFFLNERKHLDQLVAQLYKCFTLNSHHISLYSRDDYACFSVTQNIKKDVHKHWDLIKLFFLITSSRTILSETFLISLQKIHGDEEYNNISTFEGYCLSLCYFTSSVSHCCIINEIMTQRKGNIMS